MLLVHLGYLIEPLALPYYQEVLVTLENLGILLLLELLEHLLVLELPEPL